MLRPLRQFLTLVRLTALEALRQPIILLLTTACVVLTAIVPLILMHNFGEDGKLARDSGFAFHFVFGLFVAGYAACSSLTREMESGTAAAVLSKPVGREVFFLAKIAGIAAVVAAFSLCAGLATLLVERVAEKFVMGDTYMAYTTDYQTGTFLLAAPALAYLLAALMNYRLKRAFSSAAFGWLVVCLLLVLFAVAFFDRNGHFASFDFRVQWRLLPVSLLLTMALVVMSAVAAALSTRLRTAPTLAACCALLVLGLMSDYLFGRHADTSLAASALYRILPNWQHFWLPDALGGGGIVPKSYVLQVAGYALAYLAGVVGLGMLAFKHAEMK